MLPSAKADDDRARGVVGPLARLDPLEHVGLGDVHQLVGQALEPVGERPASLSCTSRASVDLPGAGALHRTGHDRDEAVVVLRARSPADPPRPPPRTAAGPGRSRTG